MKISTLVSLILAGAALPLAAQTPTSHHITAPAHHYASVTSGGCVTLPQLSSTIPALPAGSPCPKALYTLTRTPEVRLDYASPLVTPALRAELSGEKTTYSLDYVDTVVGTGPLAEPGKFYTVHYTGYLSSGTKFDSSIDRGEPITFPYGQHRVIEGWDTGFEGMRVGGKRRLYIPYQLAYGENGRPPVIPAKAELVFDVEFIAQSDQMPKPKSPPEPMRRPVTPPPAARPATPPASAAAPSTAAPAASTTKPQQ